MATHGQYWGCRKCLRLRYLSQGLAPGERLERRANGIYRRLGDADAEGLVHKPKGMRWKTFNRLIAQANELAGEADANFALRAMRLMRLL